MPQWVTNLLAELPQIAAEIAAIVASIMGGTATAADMERLNALTTLESSIMTYRQYAVNAMSVKMMEK